MDNVLKEFLVESYENLDQMDRDLVALEQDPSSQEILKNIFRTIHTIKGTCGFLGYAKLESVAHNGENLLSKLRDGELVMNSEIASALLTMVDAVRQMLGSIEATQQEGDVDYSELVATLARLQEAHPETGVVAPAAFFSTKEAVSAAPKAVAQPASKNLLGELLIRIGRAQPEDIAAALQEQEAGSNKRIGEILVGKRIVTEADVAEALRLQEIERRTPSVSENNIRVDVELLDRLMNLVGELVLARNQIVQRVATSEDSEFLATSQRLNLITTELQEGVMKTRMQPIGNIWNRFPRVVRDLASACDKQVRIDMEGKETELDKTIIEAIKDPLTHLVRNSVDHGIELPEKRLAAGKPAEGRLWLRAYHEGGQVNIEISDDGAGIDPGRIKAKALERGLISAEQAARLSEREILNLIFLPGLSTAEKVTSVSGRGVGMDVVKTNIEKISGTVDIQSTRGEGTIIRIKIPLTLAIIPALIVTSSNDQYAIPQVNLLELVRLEGEQAKRGIEHIHSAPVYRLRGNLLPLVYLDQQLSRSSTSSLNEYLSNANPVEKLQQTTDKINIVVLRADDRQFGLVVDAISDTQEIVVKPLGKLLKGIPTFAGATIMGDGRVALILDVVGIAQRANVLAETRSRALVDQATQVAQVVSEKQSLLLLRSADNGRIAIPLSLVARLEEFPRKALERSQNQAVVQYRGEILPLIRISDVLQYAASSAETDDLLRVVVYSEGGRSVGLVVDRIIDIVEDSIVVQRKTGRPGIIGSAVIQEQVTDLIDVHGIIRAADPSFFERAIAV
jgi:two-component system chemotaxis sensor kinase CheA